MDYIATPLTFVEDADKAVAISRNITKKGSMIDNLVELVIFTPKGSFDADPDFGCDYWNYEFSNKPVLGDSQDSIRQSLATYVPQLKQVSVDMELDAPGIEMQKKKKVRSKYMVTITVEGIIDDGLGTTTQYKKDVRFLMEPTTKKYRI